MEQIKEVPKDENTDFQELCKLKSKMRIPTSLWLPYSLKESLDSKANEMGISRTEVIIAMLTDQVKTESRY